MPVKEMINAPVPGKSGQMHNNDFLNIQNALFQFWHFYKLLPSQRVSMIVLNLKEEVVIKY